MGVAEAGAKADGAAVVAYRLLDVDGGLLPGWSRRTMWDASALVTVDVTVSMATPLFRRSSFGEDRRACHLS